MTEKNSVISTNKTLCHFDERSEEKSLGWNDKISRFARNDRKTLCHFDERSEEKSLGWNDKISRSARNDRKKLKMTGWVARNGIPLYPSLLTIIQ